MNLKILSATVYTPAGPREIAGEDVLQFDASIPAISYKDRATGAERIITAAGLPVIVVNEVSQIARV